MKRNLLQRKINQFFIPTDITRIDFNLNHYGNWKASEYRTFYLYIALPLFKDEIPSVNFWNLMCLVYGENFLMI
jgi:hypothetical protein